MLSIRTAWNRTARPPDGLTEHILLIGTTPQAGLATLPGNYCILLDCSGSMEGQKLQDAKVACSLAHQCLREDDLLSLVCFSSRSNALFAAQRRADLGEAALRRHLDGVAATGTTRMDLALSEARKALQPNLGPGRAAAILLITDGHPTNARGENVDEYDPFYQAAERLSADGIALVTVGLGSAGNYNSAFLTALADRGHGRFCYAPDSSGLAPLLEEQVRAAQATVVSGLQITLASRMGGTRVTSFCRATPQFLPFDAPQQASDRSWPVSCGELQAESTDAETVFLARVQTQGMFGLTPGPHPIVDVSASWQPAGGPRQASPVVTASLTFTTSLREQQVVDEEAERFRHIWDMNTYQMELDRSSDLRGTGDLLGRIAQSADQAGRPDVAAQAQAQLDDLKRTGRLDPDALARSRQSIRGTGRM